MGSAATLCLITLGAFAFLPNHAASGAPDATPVQFASAQSAQTQPPPRLVDSGAPFSFAPLVERVSPAVVSVTVEETISPNGDATAMPENIPEPFRQFFRRFGQDVPKAAPRKATSMGSGFIIDKSGLIVTNNHVVHDASKITVKLTDGRSFKAKLIGADAATDVALIKVKADKPLPTVEFGNDRSLRVGDWVIAVGNPFGLSNTVTAGIVSSLGRDINQSQPYTDFIQIDAPINRGNSGGPTFDLRGQVVGMNSMIYSPTGGSVGIGFAIPASTVKDVVAQLEAHGKVSRGWLGVLIQPVTPDMANSLGLKEPKGAMINKVVPDSPAAKAGLRQGDVIVSVNGKSVDDAHDLQRRIAAIAAGKTASLGILRNERRETVKVVIAPRKDEAVAAAEQPGDTPKNASTVKALGLNLTPLTDEVRHTYGIDDDIEGVAITKVEPNSDAAEKGLQPGEVIVSISNKKVRTPQDVKNEVAAAHKRGRKNVLLLVSTRRGTVFVAVGLDKH